LTSALAALSLVLPLKTVEAALKAAS